MSDQQSTNEEFEALIAASAEEQYSQEPASPLTRKYQTHFNHLNVVIAVWSSLFVAMLLLYISPTAPSKHPGTRSTEIRVGTAIYHVANRIETYRKFHGVLPAYLAPEWHEANQVTYKPNGDAYLLIGREGNIERTYISGEDPEQLLHSRLTRSIK
jgi:hypothetical protein